MKKYFTFLFLSFLLFEGCTKEDKNSGTDTIDNELFGTGPYYSLGFKFSTASKVSTLASPEPDVTIGNDGTLFNLILQTNSYTNSFYKVGEYSDETSAKQAFNDLTSTTVTNWVVWADSLEANQVWIFKTSGDTYAKIRIVSTDSYANNSDGYAECTFEWEYQTDGTLTFGGK